MTRKPSEMRAWICRGCGVPEILTVEGRPKPVAGDNKVLIRIHATTASSGDVRVSSLKLPRGFGLIGRLVIGITCPRQPIGQSPKLPDRNSANGAKTSLF